MPKKSSGRPKPPFELGFGKGASRPAGPSKVVEKVKSPKKGK